MFSPYSGGYGEYGVSAPRVVEVPVPVPVPYPMKGMVTDPGISGRNVDLNAPLPEGGQLETRGRGLNKYDALIGESVTKNPFTRFLGGLADALTLGTFDFDKRGDWHGSDYEHKSGLMGGSGYGKVWDQEEQNKLLEVQKKADLSGTPTPTKQEAIDSLPGRRVLDQYEAQKMQEQRNEQLKYLLAAYPQLAGMINDEIANRRYEAETRMPSEIQKRLNSSRNNYVSALLARSQAQKNIADSVATGLGRYSGIRNVAG